jgi:hypothetical protein
MVRWPTRSSGRVPGTYGTLLAACTAWEGITGEGYKRVTEALEPARGGRA